MQSNYGLPLVNYPAAGLERSRSSRLRRRGSHTTVTAVLRFDESQHGICRLVPCALVLPQIPTHENHTRRTARRNCKSVVLFSESNVVNFLDETTFFEMVSS